jgi:threonine dehydratase
LIHTRTAADPGTASGLLSVDDLRAAQAVLGDVVRRTPLEECRQLAAKVAGPAYLKCENLQRAGSFKIRGAYVRIARLAPEERARGVVAASAGNHAQGVALAAQLLGCQARVFMPIGVALPKLAATKGYGAAVELAGSTVDEALAEARAYAERTGAVFIHPFDHRDVVAGQGTVGLELAEQCPQARTVLVCTGGGGLLAGIAVAVRALLPQARVYGVQAAGAAAYPGSLRAGHPVSLTSMSTIADGIAVGRPGDVPFAHVAALVDDVLTVPDEHISRALLFCLERAKLVVEPAGATALAAVLSDPGRFIPPVVVILSGGNIDPLLLNRVIEHGLAAAGRYVRFVVRTEDRPGSLARLLSLIAELGGNVLDVEHIRHDPRLGLGEVEMALSMETRGDEHSNALLTALRSAGYRVSVHT